jgi:hypothetical protein
VPARVEILFPVGGDELEGFQSPQRGVNRAAWQPGHFHDVEPEAMALGHRLQDEETGVAEGRIGLHIFVST